MARLFMRALSLLVAIPAFAATFDETHFTYEPATGLLVQKTYPDGHSISYTYFDCGLPRRITQASGKWMERAYNDRWQMVSNFYSSADTPWVAVTPNVLGTVERVEDANGLVYDYGIRPMGQLVTNEAASSPWMSWELRHGHDGYSREMGWGLSVDGALKGGMRWQYDTEGRISHAVCTNAQGRGVSIAYTNSGSYAHGYSITLPSGSVFKRLVERDAYRRQLVTRQTYDMSGNVLFDYSYAYDALGRMTGRSETNSATPDTFSYYPPGGVAWADVQGVRFGYGFDSAGNCIGFAIGPTTNYFCHNQLNQCTALVFPDVNGAVPHAYDLDGNLTHVGGDERYGWDGENRLLTVATPGGVVTNTYDYEHRLVRQRLPGCTRLCVFDRWNLIYEKVVADGGTAMETEYFWGPDRSGGLDGACGVGGLVAVSRDGAFYFPCYGGNSEIVAYVNEQGEVIASYVYGPFGELIGSSGGMAGAFSFRYMTKRWDEAIGLYDFGSRWYSTALRRWISRDPLGEDAGLNLYTFCDTDPVNKIDPNGCIPLDTIWDLANVVYDICVGDDVALAADTAALVVPYIPAGAMKLVRAAKLSRVTKVCPGAKKLKVSYEYLPTSQYRFKHTLGLTRGKEWIKGTMNGPAKFNPGWGDAEIKGLIEDAFLSAKAQGKIKPSQLDGFIYDTGRTVGATNGKLTTKIKIHVNSDGRNLHAFPCD
ncbi:MAG: RHS repeat-associated core domain-containing protein [Kiritimatiellae bacterium]|nr:RHS repeat-associated core domain-containing protein [Kiritimatiellia bacterium]